MEFLILEWIQFYYVSNYEDEIKSVAVVRRRARSSVCGAATRKRVCAAKRAA